VGATYAIIGHSERRQYFCETDETVLKRTQAALEAGLTPIVCVGERLEEREGGKTAEVLIGQFTKGIAGLTEQQFAKIVIAYEPVWAIGTGKTATPEMAADAHRVIREQVRTKFGKDAGDAVRILYGGSVKPDNVKTPMVRWSAGRHSTPCRSPPSSTFRYQVRSLRSEAAAPKRPPPTPEFRPCDRPHANPNSAPVEIPLHPPLCRQTTQLRFR
jgi:hypothetical protein